jgi:hypothetical protein
MEFVTSKVADKIKNDMNQDPNSPQNPGMQNGFDAVNAATETMASPGTQNAGRKKKFRLTKKSRGQTK